MPEETPAELNRRILSTASIVAAYVSNNALGPSDLTQVIASVHSSLSDLERPVAQPAVELLPAVPIRKSVKPDFIVCLEDGKKFKSMRRHLSTLGMTPEQYRSKWSLPDDYPMVAPNYAAARAAIAITTGLRRKSAPETTAAKADASRK